MFKKFKRTKIVMGTAAATAMVVFPVVALAVDTQKAIPAEAFDDAASVVASLKTAQTPITETFTKNDGKLISTPETVLTVDQLGSSQFLDQTKASDLLLETPKILDSYVAGSATAFNKDAADAISKAGMYALGGAYGANKNDAAFTSFYSDAKKAKLYKDLNPDMDKHSQAGSRFNYMVPTNIMDITTYDSSSKQLSPSKSFSAPTPGNPFVYKIATIDTKKIVEDQALSLDYMYEDAGKLRKFQIVMPHSDDIVDPDAATLKSLVEDKEIFVRSMDKTDTATSPDITNPIDFANAGLTMVKDDDGISLYSSLQSPTAKSSIMIDPDTTKDAKSAATIGILGSSTQTTDGGSTKVDMKPKDDDEANNEVEDFREFSISNPWKSEASYPWTKFQGTSAVQQITFYMKKGTKMEGITTEYRPAASEEKNKLIKTPISITAGETALELTPKTPISIADGYEPDDKTFELGSAASGDWYQVTLTVEANANHPFLIGSNDASAERPWDLEKGMKQQAIFFEDPTKTTTWPTQTQQTVALKREVNDDATEQEVYRDVYSSWITPHQDGLVATKDQTKILSDLMGTVGSNPVWKGFQYQVPKKDTLDYSDANTVLTSIPDGATMADIITILNDYHNTLIGIIQTKGLTVEDNNKKDSYIPTSTTDFNIILENYLKKAVGNDVTDAIKTKIANADKLVTLDPTKVKAEIAKWKATTDHSKMPSGGNKEIFDVLKDLAKDTSDEDFNKLIDTVVPIMTTKDDPHATKSGIITIAKYVQDDIEAIIPEVFKLEFANFNNKMAGIKGKRFSNFLESKFKSNILDPSSIKLGVTKVSGIHFADIVANPKQIPTNSGEELIKDMATLFYKTGLYKTAFSANPRLEELFVKLYEADPDKSDLWNPDNFKKDANDIADALEIDKIMLTYQGADVFDAAIGQEDSKTGENLYIKKLQDLASEEAKTFVSSKEDVEFRWAAGNVYMGTNLQRDVIIANINNVIEYLKTNDKAKVLGEERLNNFIKTFTEVEQSAAAIAQLGPKLGRYKMDVFIPAFSTSPAGTEEIVEQMVHVDPIKVLLPNTGQSKAFKALEKSGGAATLGLIVGAGTLIFVIGGLLIGLSFTKRIVVGGKTWSAKMIILRVALVIVALAGIYMVLTGTVLSGHEALTTIVNV